jgi:hypothetical protein
VVALLQQYRKGLRKAAARDTAKLRATAPHTKVIWDQELANAYMDVGWQPVSESPREGYTEITLRLDA